MASGRTRTATPPADARERPDVFLSYAREDIDFAERQLTSALVAREKNVWIDVEDIRGGASDWRASVWAGIESATVMVFVLSPDSLASTVCGEELQRAAELNKRIIPVLRRSVDGLPIPDALERPNWVFARPEDDFETSVTSLIDALELDEAWVEQHARLTQRTGEWLRHDRDGSYLLRGSDLRSAESWLDDQEGHREAPTAEQITYITASRRAAARRQQSLLAGVGLALLITAVLAVVAVVQRSKAIDREKTARAQALAAQSIAALSGDPEQSVRDALAAVDIRSDVPEALYALRKAVSTAGWTSILRLPKSQRVPQTDVEFSTNGRRVATAGSDGKIAVWDARSGRRRITIVTRGGTVYTVQFSPDGRQLLTASEDGIARIWDSYTGHLVHPFRTRSEDGSELSATWGADGRRILTAGPRGAEVWDAVSGARLYRLRSASDDLRTSRMSLNGRRALTAGEGGSALLWNLQTRAEPTALPGKKTDALRYSLLSRDGRRAATFYASGRFCVWVDGRVRSPRCVPSEKVDLDVDFSRDGRRVLRAYESGRIEVWDAGSRTKEPIAVLPNGAAVVSAQFDRSGNYVVAGGDDGVARVWQVSPKRQLAVLRGHTDGVIRARFSPDALHVATVSDDGSGRLWPSRPESPIDPSWRRAESVAFSPNSRAVLIIRRRGNAWESAVWSIDAGTIVPLADESLPMPDTGSWPCGRAAGCSPWSPDSDFVTGVNAVSNAVIWDARTGEATPIGKETGTALGAAFSPDGSRVVVVYSDRPRPRIWSVETGMPGPVVPALREAGGFPFSAQFIPNSRRVLTVDASQRAQLSDPATGANVVLSRNVLPAGVAVAADGQRIAVGTTDGKLLVFSGDGTRLRSAQAPGGAVIRIAFDRTGDVIVTGGQRGTAVVWDARTLAPTPLSAPGGQVTGARFGGHDGDLVLVTAEQTPTSRLWAWKQQRILVGLPPTNNPQADFSRDGSRIVIAGKTRLEALHCAACQPLGELVRLAQALLPSS